MIAKFIRRIVKANGGNVAIVFALAALPMVFLTGMGIDYTSAVDRRVQLDAAADAAALAAVTPAMMAQAASASQAQATAIFNAQASALANVTLNSGSPVVTVSTVATKRYVTVSYTARSTNAFPGVLGTNTITIAGSAQAVAGVAPNIDFYLLLDDSPSMAIAATQSGINTMIANTTSECDSPPAGNSACGCAFGCHESHPAGENHCNASDCRQSGTGNPGGEDNYALARALGVTLRIDLLSQAAQNLMTTAQNDETANAATYRMAINTFDVNFNVIGNLTGNLSTAATEAGTIQLLEVYSNNLLTSNNNNSDADTNYDNAMQSVNTLMPNPGNGTNAQGDTPQEVLFFVTDGVEDELVNNSRQQSLMDNGWCNTIKNRGIRIAVLYTAYLPLPNNNWYNNNIASFQPNIAQTLSNCASPGLYYQVQTGGDISAALAGLFEVAVKTAYLAQ